MVEAEAGLTGSCLIETTLPFHLIRERTAKLAPTLIQNSLIEPCVLLHPLARCVHSALCALAHIGYLAHLTDHDRVVLAHLSRRLVLVVSTDVRNLTVNAGHSERSFLPVE